ncbi:hypothetical protein [Sphingomonas sp. BK481]|uniref:hypothetical protein n=1 Tax=Sphingomonas sp. BK481 TaxID=2586981 RepID=UPI0016174068|nr:hypothetical protein [Sphingomonas sp. BK481]MBB3588982.1 hypothetical protein [Sphingomonas sp. BK481]
MTDDNRSLKTAEMLMGMALALLDQQGGEEKSACHLQHALDTLRRVEPMKEGDELDPAILARFGWNDASQHD